MKFNKKEREERLLKVNKSLRNLEIKNRLFNIEIFIIYFFLGYGVAMFIKNII